MLNDSGHPRSLAELKKGLADLKAEAAVHAQKRVAAGLPAEAPSAFVKPEHAEAMIEQLKPLNDVLTEYLAITNQAQRIIPFDDSDFAPYEQRLILIQESTDSNQLIYALMLRRSIAVINEAQGGELAVGYVIGKLHSYLSMAGDCIERNRRPRNIKPYLGDDLRELIADYWTHYDSNVKEDRRLSSELS